MYFKIGIHIDESLIVHVDLIELPHYINIVYYLKMQQEDHHHRLYSHLLDQDPPQHPKTQVHTNRSQEDYSSEGEPSPSRPLVKLQIQLQNGSKVYISPQPCDEPVRLATEFCEEHNLDSQMIDVLAESIKRSITHSHQSYKKEPQLAQPLPRSPKDPYSSHSCKTTTGIRSPQYFSKKFSVNSSLGLYEKGMMLEDAKRHWIARQHERKAQQQMRECTHQPKINKLSRSLVTERDAQHQRSMQEEYSLERAPERLPLKGLPSVSSSIILLQSKQSRTPLQPRKDSNISKNGSVFSKLYEQRGPGQISRSKILSQMLKEQTHHPVINDISKEIVGSANFSERLARYEKQKAARHYKKARMEQAQKENLYRPKIGHPPQNRNTEGLPIGDFLYNKKKKPQAAKQEPSQPQINRTSKVIYDKRKAAAFHRVFQHLAQGKQRVEWQSLDTDLIDQQLLPIILPLVQEIEILQIELSAQDFKAALNYLFGTLSPTDKGILLNFRAQVSTPIPVKSASISMSKNSAAMVQQMGRARLSIYDYCEMREAIRLEKIEQERVEKQRREMQECTFEPKIDRRHIYY